MSRDQKKHEKQKKRERKVFEQKQHIFRIEKERLRRDQYPQIAVDPVNGDPEFVRLVRASLVGMDFDDRSLFQDGERKFYSLVRQYGFKHAYQRLQEVMQARFEQGDKFGRIGAIQLLKGFGTTLLSRISEVERRRYMPFNDVHVHIDQCDIIIMFSSLLSARGKDGTTFYSRQKPTIEFEGKQWNVGFSRHAIERLCQRVNPRYIEYGFSGDAHALVGNCIYFEPVLLHGNQPAFTFWDRCFTPPFSIYETYVKKILGEENVDLAGGECYYRVGYCPVAFEGDFAKATTLLYPGYSATPEYGLLQKTPLDRQAKLGLSRQAVSNDVVEVLWKHNAEAIKWFHDNGVPQVVQMNREVFVNYTDKRQRT
jgi:hypothetical protein